MIEDLEERKQEHGLSRNPSSVSSSLNLHPQLCGAASGSLCSANESPSPHSTSLSCLSPLQAAGHWLAVERSQMFALLFSFLFLELFSTSSFFQHPPPPSPSHSRLISLRGASSQNCCRNQKKRGESREVRRLTCSEATGGALSGAPASASLSRKPSEE